MGVVNLIAYCLVVVFALNVLLVTGQAVNDSTTTITTTENPDEECADLKDCEKCVSNKKCLYCEDPDKDKHGCMVYDTSVFSQHCALNYARWGSCSINYQILLIVCSVLAVVIIFIVCISICCCCRCCRNRRARISEVHEDARMTAEREERDARNSQKRAERQAKYDDIRRKYGLARDGSGTSTYSRFDNEA